MRGICEHGHFTETIHPHHDISMYREEIKVYKKLGFNFIRFHTFIPAEEYMQAADELGMLLHVESPNNTSLEEWKEIVKFCRRHTSVVIYCCGNELLMDEPFIEHLHQCADVVHKNTDSLFSPLSALRGLEYYWVEEEQIPEILEKPFKHHPRRLETVGTFSDMYSSYALGLLSYSSLKADVATLDDWNRVYNKPRVSHEICIDGTYADLSLKDRYKGHRMGLTDRLSSIERHLGAKGLLKNAPLYFKNFSEWQRRIRKHCFEEARRCKNIAGYDFLGPIDTHWHTFGYDVGMMNEFFELKPGESVRNVLMYNSATVILTDLETDMNFIAGSPLSVGVYTSHYGAQKLEHAWLQVMLSLDGRVIERRRIELDEVEYSIEIDGFKPVKIKRFIITKDGILLEDVPETTLITSEFSGEITYKAHYSLPNIPRDGERYKIVLKDTVSSARIVIDNTLVASVGITPMEACISGSLLKKRGIIEITVANTAANEIVAQNDILMSHPKEILGPYHEKSLIYEK